MQQLHLPFPEIPLPHPNLWAQLNDKQREAVVEVLARLIVQTALVQNPDEEINDE